MTADPTIRLGLDEETIDALAEAVARRLEDALPAPAEDGWLTAREAAEHLRISYSSVKERAARGDLPCHQDTPGGSLYFRRSELDGWRCASPAAGGARGRAREERFELRSHRREDEVAPRALARPGGLPTR